MKQIDIGGSLFSISENLCTYNGEPLLGKKSYGFFIKIPNICNANCAFCNKNKTEGKFSVSKMIDTIQQVMEKVRISSFSITGGEPFIDPDLLYDIVTGIHFVFPNPKISINTNGYNLKHSVNFEPYIDKIHISRHHYDDKINQDIFKSKHVPNFDEIKEIMKIRYDFVQLNCVLLKGYIDSKEEVEKYLEFHDVYNTGFVGLMPINQYSIDNFVDYNSVFPIIDPKHLNVGEYYNKEQETLICSCKDNLYLNGDHFNQYYARSVVCLNCKESNSFIFNGEKLSNSF